MFNGRRCVYAYLSVYASEDDKMIKYGSFNLNHDIQVELGKHVSSNVVPREAAQPMRISVF